MKNLLLLLISSLQLFADLPLACNLGALTPVERTEHAKLTKQLLADVERRDETSNGYAFRLDRRRMSEGDLKKWVALEKRCCPFLEFHVDTADALVLRVGGRKGVKRFIASEFQRTNTFEGSIER